MNAIRKVIALLRGDNLWHIKKHGMEIADELEAMLKQEPVRGVVFRDGEPTLVQEKHVKQTDSRLYANPRPPCDLQALAEDIAYLVRQSAEVVYTADGEAVGFSRVDLDAIIAKHTGSK